jgi:hypothetical protein
MSGSKSLGRPAPADVKGDRIDLRSRADVDRWTQSLGVSAEQLAAMVAIVGDRPSDVADYLKTHGRPTTPE